MNSKIPLRQLAERLAEKAGIMPEEAELFIKDFFNRVVIEAIESGEAVAIEGLGTFATCPDVDNPVTFIPAPEFAAEVNEPFAMFRPMEIAESIQIDEIQAVMTPDIYSQPEPVTEIISEDEDEAIAEAAEVEQDEAADEEPEVAEPVTDESDNSVSSDNSEKEPEKEPEKELETPAVSPILPPELPTEEPASALPPELPESMPVEGPFIQEETPLQQAEEEAEEEIKEEVLPEPDNVSDEAEDPQPSQIYIPEDEEEFVTYHNRPKSRMGLGFVLGLITGLVVAALALAGYVLFIADGTSKLF